MTAARNFSALSLLTVAAFFGALAQGCGDAKPDAKTPQSGTGLGANVTKPAPTTSSSAMMPPDQVPNKPTAAGVNIDKEILRACGIPEPEAHFGFDSTAVQEKDRTPLDKVAECFVSGPLKGRKVRLVGHADARGPDDYNMKLGQNRADSIAGYLKKKGMTEAQTDSTTRGAMDAQGKDEPSFALDRRVDVMLSQ